jgi:hypothetical protein
MVTHTCSPSTQEAETGGQSVQGHPGLHSKTPSQKEKKISTDLFSQMEKNVSITIE